MNITVSYEISKSQIENFEGLVSEVFYSMLEIGRELVREALEQADETVMESRDRKRYRCKGVEKACSWRQKRFAVLLTGVRPG